MNKLPVLIAFMLALWGCGEAPPLEGARLGTPFQLTNQNGERMSDQKFAGQYRIVYIGYTFCPDVCPTDAQALGGGLRRFEAISPARAKRVTPIFISADPKRDTPAVLKKFLANFHPRFVGLTGTEAEIDALLGKFGSYATRGKPDSYGGYLVDHGRITVLYGPDGTPIAPIPSDEGTEAVAKMLDRWVR
jgi:protein SCO1